jgi:hypothetical protein
MSIREERTPPCQRIDIGRARLWMATKTPHPVVEIVDGDH